jgi:hypothetical protein
MLQHMADKINKSIEYKATAVEKIPNCIMFNLVVSSQQLVINSDVRRRKINGTQSEQSRHSGTQRNSPLRTSCIIIVNFIK